MATRQGSPIAAGMRVGGLRPPIADSLRSCRRRCGLRLRTQRNPDGRVGVSHGQSGVPGRRALTLRPTGRATSSIARTVQVGDQYRSTRRDQDQRLSARPAPVDPSFARFVARRHRNAAGEDRPWRGARPATLPRRCGVDMLASDGDRRHAPGSRGVRRRRRPRRGHGPRADRSRGRSGVTLSHDHILMDGWDMFRSYAVILDDEETADRGAGPLPRVRRRRDLRPDEHRPQARPRGAAPRQRGERRAHRDGRGLVPRAGLPRLDRDDLDQRPRRPARSRADRRGRRHRRSGRASSARSAPSAASSRPPRSACSAPRPAPAAAPAARS